MSSTLTTDQETIIRVISGLEQSIAELELSQRNHAPVTGQAFGASSGGTAAHESTNRAHKAIIETLADLRAAHAEFTASLRQVQARIQDTDEQARTVALRRQQQVAEVSA